MKAKIYISMLLAMCLILVSFSVSNASSIGDIFTGGNNFINSGNNTAVNENVLKDTSNILFKILTTLGISIAVIMTGVLGIKFMLGSVEEKAEVQEKLIILVIGCIVVFGAFSIWSIVVNIGNKIA